MGFCSIISNLKPIVLCVCILIYPQLIGVYLKADCKVDIADKLHGDVSVNVDTCSKPVDVTISIQVQ